MSLHERNFARKYFLILGISNYELITKLLLPSNPTAIRAVVSISSNRRRGLDNQNRSNTATASKGLGVCKGCKVHLNPRKEYCKSCKREGDMNREKTNPLQSPPKMNIKRSVPNISSSKRSCEYAGCKNTTSKGKMYCGLHYLEGVERSSKRSCDMHACECM